MSLVFFPTHPLNSLDGLLLAFPFPPTISKFFNPIYWCDVLLGFLGLFLLFSLWLADTVDWLLVCASWLLLIFLILQPLYWPWYMLLPLTLALCASRGKTLLLAILLLVGSLFSYYCWLRELTWPGQALFILGFPCLAWGWYMFFTSTWELTLGKEEELTEVGQQDIQRPRPPWFSHPSWPSRPGKIR